MSCRFENHLEQKVRRGHDVLPQNRKLDAKYLNFRCTHKFQIIIKPVCSLYWTLILVCRDALFRSRRADKMSLLLIRTYKFQITSPFMFSPRNYNGL